MALNFKRLSELVKDRNVSEGDLLMVRATDTYPARDNRTDQIAVFYRGQDFLSENGKTIDGV